MTDGKLDIKYYNAMNDGKKFFNQPTKDDYKTYENIFKN